MRFFHLSDLHLGKKVNGFSMIEEQKDILNKIIEFAKEYKPDSVLIAGDIYDKSFPVVDAIDILDKFIVSLSKLNISVFTPIIPLPFSVLEKLSSTPIRPA